MRIRISKDALYCQQDSWRDNRCLVDCRSTDIPGPRPSETMWAWMWLIATCNFELLTLHPIIGAHCARPDSSHSNGDFLYIIAVRAPCSISTVILIAHTIYHTCHQEIWGEGRGLGTRLQQWLLYTCGLQYLSGQQKWKCKVIVLDAIAKSR